MKPVLTAGTRLFIHEDMDAVALVPIGAGCAAVSSLRCPGKETANEDCAMVANVSGDSAVIAVADGLGGQRFGEQASRVALETIAAALNPAERSEMPLRSAILNGIEQANRTVLALGMGAATTLAVVEIEGGRVRPYHVGDSVILVVGQRGRVRWQTVPHSPVGFAVEAGVLDEREAMHHEDRHVVSNVLGSNEMRIEIGPILELNARDTVLIASDGLFDNLHLEEIVEHVRKGPLEKAVATLVADARRRMQGADAQSPSKPDDLTVIAFRRSDVATRRRR